MSLCPLSTDFYKFKCEKFSCSSENCFNWHGCCVCGGSELISTQILCLFFYTYCVCSVVVPHVSAGIWARHNAGALQFQRNDGIHPNPDPEDGFDGAQRLIEA